MEKTTEFINLRKITHRVYCDDCNIELKSGNIAYMTYPPLYSYNCPNCNKQYTFLVNYPWSEIIGDEIEVKI